MILFYLEYDILYIIIHTNIKYSLIVIIIKNVHILPITNKDKITLTLNFL